MQLPVQGGGGPVVVRVLRAGGGAVEAHGVGEGGLEEVVVPTYIRVDNFLMFPCDFVGLVLLPKFLFSAPLVFLLNRKKFHINANIW